MNREENFALENLHDADVVCIYGQSDLSLNLFLTKWQEQKNNRYLVFIEDDKEKYKVLEKNVDQYLKKDSFRNHRIKTFFLSNPIEKTLKKLAWNFVNLNLKIIKASNEKRKKSFDNISRNLNELLIGANVLLDVYSDFGIRNFENLYNNLLKTNEVVLFDSLKNKFKDIPAIIVGAGPSLDKNVELLNEVSDKALIFVGGSAINVLSKKNIKFHFSAQVDQNLFFKKFKDNNLFLENIFFYQNQINYEMLPLVHCNKILLFDSGIYLLERWIYEQLDIKQDMFETGWNVSTFLIEIAILLGCKKIYFLGLDLCYKNKKYAKDVTLDQNDYHLIKTKDINNNLAFTQKDWFLAKKWIEKLVLENRNLEFVNATEGGLKIEKIENKKFSEVIESLQKTYDFHGYIHAIYENQNKMKLEENKIKDILNRIKKSLEKIDNLCDETLKDIEYNVFDKNLIKFQKEITYICLLDPLWQIWKHVLLRNIAQNEKDILINKIIFFKNVIFQHLDLLNRSLG